MVDLWTNAKISPPGKLNERDVKKIWMDTLRFFSAPIVMYLLQVQGTLMSSGGLQFNDLVPSAITLGSIYGWGLGILLNVFLKFRDGSK